MTVAPTAGLITTEAGGTATFTVALTSEPMAAVTNTDDDGGGEANSISGLVYADPNNGRMMIDAAGTKSGTASGVNGLRCLAMKCRTDWQSVLQVERPIATFCQAEFPCVLQSEPLAGCGVRRL